MPPLCLYCNTILNTDNWFPSYHLHNKHICKTCYNTKYNRKFYAKRSNRNLKIKVLSHYSNSLVCERCGFSDIRALSLDHIAGNGYQDRQYTTERGSSYYRWLVKNNYPSGYQVLCMNCQWIKRDENDENKKALNASKNLFRLYNR